jgi:hypothetical protein
MAPPITKLGKKFKDGSINGIFQSAQSLATGKML